MPLGDRFGDPISESAARDFLGTSGESRELLACASGLWSTVDHSRSGERRKAPRFQRQ